MFDSRKLSLHEHINTRTHTDTITQNAAVERRAEVWEKFIMNELHGQTVGFVGFGDIAQALDVISLRLRVSNNDTN
jgi:phosphoglycerate dehydrogenase-like enzyme